jgi:hypothetical protein
MELGVNELKALIPRISGALWPAGTYPTAAGNRARAVSAASLPLPVRRGASVGNGHIARKARLRQEISRHPYWTQKGRALRKGTPQVLGWGLFLLRFCSSRSIATP